LLTQLKLINEALVAVALWSHLCPSHSFLTLFLGL